MVDKAKLRGAMARAGMSQQRLAEAMGISKNTLSNKINGKTSFDVQQVDRICKLLGIRDAAQKSEIFLSRSSQMWDIREKSGWGESAEAGRGTL